MKSTLYPLCAVIAWSVVLVKAKQLRHARQRPAQATLWSAFLFIALTFTASSSVVWERLETVTWLSEAPTLIAQSCVACFSSSTLILLMLWSFPMAQVKGRIIFTLTGSTATVTTMVVLFVWAQRRHKFEVGFDQWYGASTVYDAYLLVYLSIYTVTLAAIIRLCWRFARLAPRSWLRAGLRTTAAGAVIGTVYAVSRLTDILAARLGVDLTAWNLVAKAGASAGALVVMLGLSMPAWGPRLSRASNCLRLVRAHRQLYPLWASLYEWNPDIALDPPQRLTRWRTVLAMPHELDYRIRRRVIEIRDGLLTLHPQITDEIRSAARSETTHLELTGDALAAATEARVIHRAMVDATYIPPQPDEAEHARASTNKAARDFEAELAWLVALATSFADTSAEADHPVLMRRRTMKGKGKTE